MSFGGNKQLFSCEKCAFACNVKSKYDRHISTTKHKIRMVENQSETKMLAAFECTACKYTCNYKSNFDRHVITEKHLNNITSPHIKPSDTIPQRKYVCKCSKSYTGPSALWYHKKRCAVYIEASEPLSKNTVQSGSDTNQINNILTTSHAKQIVQLTRVLNEQSITYATQIAETESRAAKQVQQVEARAKELVRQTESRAENLIKQSEAHIAKQINIMVEAVQKIANSR
jgi:hypothetical protein